MLMMMRRRRKRQTEEMKASFIFEVGPYSCVEIAENDQDRRTWPDHLGQTIYPVDQDKSKVTIDLAGAECIAVQRMLPPSRRIHEAS